MVQNEKTLGNGRSPQFSKLKFYLDGAHSPESMEACARWFCDTVKAESVTSYVVESDNGGNAAVLPLHSSSCLSCFRRVCATLLLLLIVQEVLHTVERIKIMCLEGMFLPAYEEQTG